MRGWQPRMCGIAGMGPEAVLKRLLPISRSPLRISEVIKRDIPL